MVFMETIVWCVVNAYIWPKHTHGDHLLFMFDLESGDLNDPRNYLQLTKAFQLAFDNETVTIIYTKQSFGTLCIK